MIYFSELKGKEIYTEDNIKVGNLEDLIFLASETPNVTKLVIRDLSGNKLVIPVSYLRKINYFVSIRKDYQVADLSENELHLVKNLLDKQIIDLHGEKIVRVNDIAIQDRDGFYIAGVDIGILGILRWLKLENIFNKIIVALHLRSVSPFLSWADIQPLELSYGKVKLKKEEKRLEKLHPEDLADYLEKTNIVNTKKILKMLDEKFAADVISNLNINFQTTLFKQFTPEKAAKVLELVDSDDAIDILLTLSTKKRERIIRFLQEPKKREIDRLLKLSKTSIGEFLTTEYLTVMPTETVRMIIDRIKKETSDFSIFTAVYVLNDQKQLAGVFSLHELMLQNLDTPVYKFMIQNIIVAHLSTPREIVFKKMLKYSLGSIPVIDDEKHIVGIVTFDDLARFILEKIN